MHAELIYGIITCKNRLVVENMDFFSILEQIAANDDVDKIVVGAVIRNSCGKILLVKRKINDFMGGIYEIPGGNSEQGENICDTLIREVKEETNLNVTGIGSYINYFDYTSDEGKKCRQFNFVVDVNPGKIILTEHDYFKWVDYDDICSEKLISKEVKECILIYLYNSSLKENAM